VKDLELGEKKKGNNDQVQHMKKNLIGGRTTAKVNQNELYLVL